MFRPLVAHIDLEALHHNQRRVLFSPLGEAARRGEGQCVWPWHD